MSVAYLRYPNQPLIQLSPEFERLVEELDAEFKSTTQTWKRDSPPLDTPIAIRCMGSPLNGYRLGFGVLETSLKIPSIIADLGVIMGWLPLNKPFPFPLGYKKS